MMIYWSGLDPCYLLLERAISTAFSAQTTPSWCHLPHTDWQTCSQGAAPTVSSKHAAWRAPAAGFGTCSSARRQFRAAESPLNPKV